MTKWVSEVAILLGRVWDGVWSREKSREKPPRFPVAKTHILRVVVIRRGDVCNHPYNTNLVCVLRACFYWQIECVAA